MFSGNTSQVLANKVCEHLGIPKGKADIGHFNDGEVSVVIQECVRDKNIFIIQSTSTPSAASIMELLLMCTGMNRASCKTITAVIPYFGYGRSDGALNIHEHQSFGAADISAMLETAGVNRIISINLHSGQIQGFFAPRLTVDDIDANPVAALFFKDKIEMRKPTIIVPQPSAIQMGKEFQELFYTVGYKDTHLAMVIERPGSSEEEYELIGNVKDRDCVIVNDILDTGNIISNTSKVLKANGCNHIFAYSPHGVFSHNAVERINECDVDKVVVTDTIDLPKELGPKITKLSIAPLLAEVIYCVATKRSISERLCKIFNEKEE